MKPLSEFINEAATDQVWVAIEDVLEPNTYYPKGRTSYRVVTSDTWEKLRRGEKETYGEHTYTELGRSKNKDVAMSYLPSSEKKARKSNIDKKGADYIVYAISSGKLTPSGNSSFYWNFWELIGEGDQPTEIYVGRHGMFSFLFGAPGTLKKGDTVFVVDNDTQRKCSTAMNKVEAVLSCKSKEDFVEQFRKEFPSLCKRPSVSFGRKIDGLPWSSFGQVYSIKGVSE